MTAPDWQERVGRRGRPVWRRIAKVSLYGGGVVNGRPAPPLPRAVSGPRTFRSGVRLCVYRHGRRLGKTSRSLSAEAMTKRTPFAAGQRQAVIRGVVIGVPLKARSRAFPRICGIRSRSWPASRPTRMPIDIFPTLELPVIYIAQPYGGLNPQQMESQITALFQTGVLMCDDVIADSPQSVANRRCFLRFWRAGGVSPLFEPATCAATQTGG